MFFLQKKEAIKKPLIIKIRTNPKRAKNPKPSLLWSIRKITACLTKKSAQRLAVY